MTQGNTSLYLLASYRLRSLVPPFWHARLNIAVDLSAHLVVTRPVCISSTGGLSSFRKLFLGLVFEPLGRFQSRKLEFTKECTLPRNEARTSSDPWFRAFSGVKSINVEA
jgi:hypothetical protein